jgi:hypothetical protein
MTASPDGLASQHFENQPSKIICLKYDAVQSGKQLPTFRGDLMLSSPVFHFSTLIMEIEGSSKTLVTVYQNTRRHFLEDGGPILQSHSRESLKNERLH